MTLSLTTFGIIIKLRYLALHQIPFTLMFRAVRLSITMLSATLLNVVMLNATIAECLKAEFIYEE
jgi:hypothetical protein